MKSIEKYIAEKPWPACCSVLVLGLALRLFHLGSKSLWVDEAYAAGLMGMDPVQLVRFSIAGSPHPPLAFLFLRISTMIFGHGEAGLRMMPALCSALAAVPLMLFIARRLGRRPAFWAGLLWAAAPYSVSLGQEAWLYGIMSLLGFVLLDLADRAWHGSRPALCLMIPAALVGMAVQHMFLMFAGAAAALYFTVPRDERVSLKTMLSVTAIFIILYAPLALLMVSQASFRARRIAGAGLDMSAVYRYRFLLRIPTVYARLIPGGVLAEAGGSILHDGKQLVFWIFFSVLDLLLVAVLLLRNSLERGFRIWLLLILLIPFPLFLVEDPTVRHLCILWVPMGFAAAAASDRWRLAGPVLVLSAAALLPPYYNTGSFPYHRSDWRGAVRLVEEMAAADEGVLVIGGNSGGLAWDYYSTTSIPRASLGGEDPYTEHAAPRRSLSSAVDSLFEVHPSIWVVNDMWGGPSITEMLDGHTVLWATRVSPSMEVARFSE